MGVRAERAATSAREGGGARAVRTRSQAATRKAPCERRHGFQSRSYPKNAGCEGKIYGEYMVNLWFTYMVHLYGSFFMVPLYG